MAVLMQRLALLVARANIEIANTEIIVAISSLFF
jgi:hypothetical protein